MVVSSFCEYVGGGGGSRQLILVILEGMKSPIFLTFREFPSHLGIHLRDNQFD